MVFLTHSFVGTRVLKVLVVPIGENSLFDAHFDLISRMKFLPKEELGYSNSMLSKSQAFRNFQWDEGTFVFDYVRYDVAKGGHEIADYLDSSQRVLIVLGLVNHPELGDSSDNMEDELKFFARNHPFISIRRLVVFNYDYGLTVNINKNDGELPILRPLSDDKDSLILCPPEGDQKGTSQTQIKDTKDSNHNTKNTKNTQNAGTLGQNSKNSVESRLKLMLAEISVTLFESLQKEMLSCEDARVTGTFPYWLLQATKKSTNIAGNVIKNKVSEEQSRESMNAGVMALTKRVQSGRLRKFMGDLSLQVSSPVDALSNYSAAISECRTSGDFLWLAGALEGYASSVLTLLDLKPSNSVLEEHLGSELKSLRAAPAGPKTLQYRMGLAKVEEVVGDPLLPPEETVEATAVRLAQEKCAEALAIYASNSLYSYFEASCSLRLAKMFADLGSKDSRIRDLGCESGPWSVGVMGERHNKISQHILRAVSVPGLTPQQRVEITAQGAVVFRRAGLGRKYSLLLYMAALMSSESGNVQTGHMLMQKCFTQYGMMLRKDNTSETNNNSSSSSSGSNNTGSSIGNSPITGEFSPTGGIGGNNKEKEAEERMQKEQREQQESDDKEQLYSGLNAWTNMRLQLYAHSTYIARETGDLNAATGTLCAMIRLMGALEMRQQQQLTAWSDSICSERNNRERENRDNMDTRDNRDNRGSSRDGKNTEGDIDTGDDPRGKEHSAGKLLLTSEGRKTLTGELISRRWQMERNVQERSTDNPVLTASNVSRLGFSSSAGNFGLLGSGGAGRSGSSGNGSVAVRFTRGSANSKGSAKGGMSGGKRGGSSASMITAFASEFESKIGVRQSLRLEKQEVLESIMGERGERNGDRNGGNGDRGERNGGERNGGNGSTLGGARTSFSLQRDTIIEQSTFSKYDEKIEEIEFKGKRRGSRGSGRGSEQLTPRFSQSISGSVSSSSSYSMFSPPSILGISTNTEKKRLNLLKKKHPQGTTGRLITAQLQSFQQVTNTASDAATYLSSIILPDGQTIPTHPVAQRKGVTPLGVLKGGLRGLSISSNLKVPYRGGGGGGGGGSVGGGVQTVIAQQFSRPLSVTGQRNTDNTPLNTPLNTPFTPFGTPYTPFTPLTTSTSVKSFKAEDMVTSSIMTSDDIITETLDLCLESLSRMLFEGGVSGSQQEQGVELLDQLGREVQPDTAALLPYIAVSIRPLLLQGPEAPLKGSLEEQKRWDASRAIIEEKKMSLIRITQNAQNREKGENGENGENAVNCYSNNRRRVENGVEKVGTEKSSALFYDPFEARRVKDTDTRTEVLWSVGATCSAVVVFKNPLSCPLYLTAVTLIGDGVEHVSTPRSVVISPRTRGVTVELSITPLKEGSLKILGVELSIYNVVHRLYTDRNGNIPFTSELPSPWQYLPSRFAEKSKSVKDKEDKKNKEDEENKEGRGDKGDRGDRGDKGDKGKSVPRSGVIGEVETSLVTIAPAAPSLDLLPGWETQHLDSNLPQYSLSRLLDLMPDWGERNDGLGGGGGGGYEEEGGEGYERGQGGGGGGGFIERIAALSLCPGERRLENVHAVLQPLLTDVRGGMRGVGGVGGVNSSGDGRDSGVGTWVGGGVGVDVGHIAEDIRITIHQWSKSLGALGVSGVTGVSGPLHVLPGSPVSQATMLLSATAMSNNLVKTSSLQRDFSGPLKKELTSHMKSRPLISSTIGCKLINIENDRNERNNSDNSDRNDSHDSLSVPLGLEFQFIPGVVAYRLDVETLALNSGKNTDVFSGENDGKNARSVRSQLYLRRSSLYVRVQASPSVELLCSHLITLPVTLPISPINKEGNGSSITGSSNDRERGEKEVTLNTQEIQIKKIETKKYMVLKVHNGSRLIAAVGTSQKAAIDVLTQHIVRSRQQYVQPYRPYSSLEVSHEILKYGNNGAEDNGNNGNKDETVNGGDKNGGKNGGKHVSKKLEFSELLDPESTRNVIVPMDIWRRSVKASGGGGGGAVSDRSTGGGGVEGVGGGGVCGLHWAIYDQFSSSFTSSSFSPSPSSSFSADGSCKGSIRTGMVIDRTPLSLFSFPGGGLESKVQDLESKVQGLKSKVQGLESDPRSLRATLLLLQGEEPLISSAYPVSSKNTLTVWEYYNLQVQILSNIGDTDGISSLPPPPSSSSHSSSSSSHVPVSYSREYEILISVTLQGESIAKESIESKETKNNAVINGKNRFIVSNTTGQKHGNNSNNRLLATHALQICFPATGMFSVYVLCRPLGTGGNEGKEGKEGGKYYSISTLLVEVHN